LRTHRLKSLCCLTIWITFSCLFLEGAATDRELLKARDQQNLPALDNLIAQYKKTAEANPGSAEAQYNSALAYSFAAEVAMQLRDKRKSESYAVAGLDAAKKAVAEKSSDAEYHRLLGALCGQVIPANPIMGALSYGSCARDEINKAISLDRHLALAYVTRAIGNFYLPAQMGGGIDLALKDIDEAISLDPKSSDAYMWKGVILRKANRNNDARQAFSDALRLDPDRLWAKQQLEKTPPR
jgi:tetratricopeptide (TPR) repeat protein